MKNYCFGSYAGCSITTGFSNIVIGPKCDVPPNANRCIVIGRQIRAKRSRHLIIGSPNRIFISRTMTMDEWEILHKELEYLFTCRDPRKGVIGLLQEVLDQWPTC